MAQREGDSDAQDQIDLFGGQLRVCWVVTGSVQELVIRVDDTTVRADATAGCSFIREGPRVAKLEVRFLGAGRWIARVEEQSRPQGQVRVPPVGAEPAAAEAVLKAAGLVVARGTGCEPREPTGAVIGVEPAPGVAVSKGSTVTVTLNRPITVPSVIGKRPADAERELRAAALIVEIVDIFVAEGERPKPDVVGQYPDGGKPACPGESISIEVERLS